MNEKPSDTDKNFQYLSSKGWYLHKVKWGSGQVSYTFVHPTLAPEKRGGYTDIKDALKSQNEQDNHDAGKCWYYVTKDSHGNSYGYLVRESSPDKKKRIVFNTSDIEIAKKRRDELNIFGKCDLVALDNDTQYPYLLILKEKHSERQYHVPTLQSLFRTCRAIVMDRLEEEYWYGYLFEESDEDYPEPDVSKEEIEKWKDGPLKKAAKEQWDSYEYSLSSKKDEKDEKRMLEFIKENDNFDGGLQSYAFLKSRGSGEYEGIEFTEFETL